MNTTDTTYLISDDSRLVFFTNSSPDRYPKTQNNDNFYKPILITKHNKISMGSLWIHTRVGYIFYLKLWTLSMPNKFKIEPNIDTH